VYESKGPEHDPPLRRMRNLLNPQNGVPMKLPPAIPPNRHLAYEHKNPGHLIGSRKGRPTATYLPQHLEALPARLTRTIELAKDLFVLLSVAIL